MAKIIAVSILGIVTFGAIGIEHGDRGALIPLASERGEPITLIEPLGQRDSLRNLLLSALGTGQVGAEQLRIPVPTEGTVYEVIIAKPGLPKSVHVASADAD